MSIKSGTTRTILLAGAIVSSINGCDSNDGQVTDAESRRGKLNSSFGIDTKARFVDIAKSAGVQFAPQNGQAAGHLAILESLGAGIALFDYDADGDLDLFVPGGGEFGPKPDVRGLPSALYRSEKTWQFENLTANAGLETSSLYSHGAIVGDYDGDGFPDLLVTGYGGLLLYHNLGDGRFEERAQAAGLANPFWCTSAAWGDVNGDTILDLFVVNYVDWSFSNHPKCRPQGRVDVCPPATFQAISDTLFLGNGDGTFRNGSAEAGLSAGGKGLAALLADVDLDGDLDVYVANDTTPNFLYRNEGQGRLHEVGLLSGTAMGDTTAADGSMGVDIGDFNLDGLPDLWVANFESQSFALYRNDGDCLFQHVSSTTGISAVGAVYVGFGTVFLDFDRDGDEDLFASNGHVMYEPRNAPFFQKPLLFENLQGERFVNVAEKAGPYMQTGHMGRGVAVGDIDDDGDLDLAVSHTNQPVSLLSNESENAGHWLRVQLIGVRSHRDAVGTMVRVRVGKRWLIRQVKGGSSYLSSSDPRLFFGLGLAESIDQIHIHWPSGIEDELNHVDVDQTIVLIEPLPEP